MSEARLAVFLVHSAWPGNGISERMACRLRMAGYPVHAPSLTRLCAWANPASPEVKLDVHIADMPSTTRIMNLAAASCAATLMEAW